VQVALVPLKRPRLTVQRLQATRRLLITRGVGSACLFRNACFCCLEIILEESRVQIKEMIWESNILREMTEAGEPERGEAGSLKSITNLAAGSISRKRLRHAVVFNKQKSVDKATWLECSIMISHIRSKSKCRVPPLERPRNLPFPSLN
jgi:hypothetical protein